MSIDMLFDNCSDTFIFGVLVKFVCFEKATKFDEIFILLLTNKFMFFVSRYSFKHQPGSQSWKFMHWDQPNSSKDYLCLDTDKFVLSFFAHF